MPRFSKVLLLVSFTLLSSLFVNGIQELSPTVNYKHSRRNGVIRGLLVSRQDVCDPGFVGCEATGCCPVSWNCCISSSFPSTISFFFKFHYWPKFSQVVTAVNLGKSFKWASCFNGLKYMWLQDLLCCCEQWHHWLLWERSSLFGTSRGSDHY